MSTHEHHAGEFGSVRQTGMSKDPAYRAGRARHYAGKALEANVAHLKAVIAGDKVEAAKHALLAAHAENRAKSHAEATQALAPGSAHAVAAHNDHLHAKIHNDDVRERSGETRPRDSRHGNEAEIAKQTHANRASARANQLSSDSSENHTVQRHEEAARAHTSAAAAHADAGNTKLAERHTSEAQRHAALVHAARAEDATNRANTADTHDAHASASSAHAQALTEVKRVGLSAQMRYHGRMIEDHDKRAVLLRMRGR